MRFYGKSQQKLPNFTALLAAIGEPRKGKSEQKPKISFTHRQFFLCRIDGHARTERRNEGIRVMERRAAADGRFGSDEKKNQR
jgi:hypothetical protein